MRLNSGVLAAALASLLAVGGSAPTDPPNSEELVVRSEVPEDADMLQDRADALEERQMIKPYSNCYPWRGMRVTYAPKLGFRTFIDKIPNTINSLKNAPYGFQATIANRTVCVTLERACSDCGTVAGGENIRRMLHDGYANCVLTGYNSVADWQLNGDPNADSFFWTYQMANENYTVTTGLNSRTDSCPGTPGVPGTLIQIKV